VGLPPVLHARPTLIAKRMPDGWKIVAFQNTMVTPELQPGRIRMRLQNIIRSTNGALRPDGDN